MPSDHRFPSLVSLATLDQCSPEQIKIWLFFEAISLLCWFRTCTLYTASRMPVAPTARVFAQRQHVGEHYIRILIAAPKTFDKKWHHIPAAVDLKVIACICVCHNLHPNKRQAHYTLDVRTARLYWCHKLARELYGLL